MTDIPRAAEVTGRTIRFIWDEGPTKGMTHEHVFHPDGTVEWHAPGEAGAGAPSERPAFGAFRVREGVVAVSYLAPSGYTLTVVLNYDDKGLVGFASGATDWYPLRGRFEVVD